MKCTVLGALLCLLVPACIQNGAPDTRKQAATDSALLAQERAWTEAFKNRDGVALNALLADDFIFTDDAGNIYDKTAYISAVMDLIQVSSYSVDSTTVLSHGDVGIVAGRWTGAMTIGGKDASGSFRFTDTFLHTPSGWRVIASQDTRLPTATAK